MTAGCAVPASSAAAAIRSWMRRRAASCSWPVPSIHSRPIWRGITAACALRTSGVSRAARRRELRCAFPSATTLARLETAGRRPHTGAMSKEGSLTNHLLVAMPGLDDPNFAQTVTLICEHGSRGALGIVLNKPLTMRLSEVLAQMKLPPEAPAVGEQIVLRGGPVHQDRGFVLHRPGGSWESTHRISDHIQVTTSRDVLAAMAKGAGP